MAAWAIHQFRNDANKRNSDVAWVERGETGHWLDDYDSTGATLQQALWLDDLPVGLIANGNQLHYLEPDHLGTPRVVIEVARNVPVWTWDLKGEAFGNSVPDQNPDGDAWPLVFDMRFPGQRYDAASGLNQNGERDYDMGGGRYVQSDPIGLGGGISTYAYAYSQPTMMIDPYGLSALIAPRITPIQMARPFASPMDSAVPIPYLDPLSPNDPNGEFCRSLARRIANTKNEIYNKRWIDLILNPDNLPWRIGPGEKLKETGRGHEKLLNRRLGELKKLEDEYDQKCRGPIACL